jgi:predicted alpha/beta hydrolase
MEPNANLNVSTADGASFEMAVYDGSPDQPAVLVFPAMGTYARLYKPLAGAFRNRGWSAALVDLRGHATHSVRASRRSDFGYADLLRYDWPAAIAAARNRFPRRPLYLLGHSLGGQLSALHLAENPSAAEGLMLVASCSVYYRGWDGFEGLKLLAQTQLVGLIARVGGVFPGDKVGFAGREAKTQMLDWSRQSRTGRYQLRNTGFDYERALQTVKHPLLAISVEGDTFAPPKAVDILCAKMPQAALTRKHHPMIDAIRKSPHFAWAKHPDWIVEQALAWGAREEAL